MGKFTEFKLPLKSLPKGKHVFTFKVGKQFFEDMESTDVRDANLDVTVMVDYNGEVYDLNFVVKGEVTVLCDRCLDEMQWPIDATYHIMVKYGDDYRDDSDELLEIPFNVNDLNVAYMIYDTASLAIPIKHVHPMGKCNRQMSAMLRKHRATRNDEDAELEEELMEGIDDDVADNDDTAAAQTTATDPRWDALRGIATVDGDDDDADA